MDVSEITEQAVRALENVNLKKVNGMLEFSIFDSRLICSTKMFCVSVVQSKSARSVSKLRSETSPLPGQTLSALVRVNNFMVNFMVITWGTQLIPRHGLISIPSVLQQINSNNFHGDLISISNNFLKCKFFS